MMSKAIVVIRHPKTNFFSLERHCGITKIISVALLLCPGFGLPLLESKQECSTQIDVRYQVYKRGLYFKRIIKLALQVKIDDNGPIHECSKLKQINECLKRRRVNKFKYAPITLNRSSLCVRCRVLCK